MVKDLKSKGGTFVEGGRIPSDKAKKVFINQKITIGDHVMQVHRI
jgi:pSer/pThr/pTyr-binding forkhead associated (FHA) protein